MGYTMGICWALFAMVNVSTIAISFITSWYNGCMNFTNFLVIFFHGLKLLQG